MLVYTGSEGWWDMFSHGVLVSGLGLEQRKRSQYSTRVQLKADVQMKLISCPPLHPAPPPLPQL